MNNNPSESDFLGLNMDDFKEIFENILTNEKSKNENHNQKILEIKNKINALRHSNISDKRYEIDMKLLKEELKQLDKQQDHGRNIDNFAMNLLGNLGNAGINHATLQSKKKINQDNMILKGMLDNEGKQERLKLFFENLFNKNNLSLLGLAITGTTAGLTIIYYGGKLGFRYIDAKIGKPSLIRESSRKDWRNSFKEWFRTTIFGKNVPEVNLKEVVLTPEMSKNMQMLAEDSKNSFENALPFRNTLFYGLPGTGKTMFAKKLALYCNMDFAIMSGADFAQFKNGEGITELHKLFDWAEQSNRGMLIFIDEADAFLRDRRVLNNHERNLVNAFLSRTGESSNKFTIILASNYENELDPAVLSRIHKKIYFPLPETHEREKIIKLYFNKYILNDHRTINKNGQKIELSITTAEEINQKSLAETAEKINGFS
ncbi:AAA family ATPase, partial [Candidatus Dependentiae bacterium]